jgi:hypothetical protein
MPPCDAVSAKGEIMGKLNPVNAIVSLCAGWFVMAFLHAVCLSIYSGGMPSLLDRFLGIALFRDRAGSMLNLFLIVICGAIGSLAWVIAKRSEKK